VPLTGDAYSRRPRPLRLGAIVFGMADPNRRQALPRGAERAALGISLLAKSPPDRGCTWYAISGSCRGLTRRRRTTLFQEMAAKTITCPDCGLVLQGEGSQLTYDIAEWRRRCKRVHLDSPSWCLIQRNGTSKPNGPT